MSGSGYAIGLGIASYEWMAALTLLIVGKFFLPIFLKNQIYTMPEFLKRRYGKNIQFVMAIFWLVLYVFVNLTSILWLGATAVHTVTGLTLQISLIVLGLFAGNYALYGGLKAVAFTDVVQVSMLVLGGLVIVYIALEKISGGSGRCGRGRRLPHAGGPRARPLPHDPEARQSVLQGSAGHLRDRRRHVDHQSVLLGLQPVHHPARAGREKRRAKRRKASFWPPS